MVDEEKALFCFLDKKWFYTTGCRIMLKHLPRAPEETEGVDCVKLPRALSHRFPAKMVFTGVVAKPLPELGFDRIIFMKRIS